MTLHAEAAAGAVPALACGGAVDHPIGRLQGLAQALARAARERADGRVTCLARDGRETAWTFRSLHDDAQRAAAALHARGITPGSRVVLRLGDPAAFVLALWACGAGGLVAIPTNAYGELPRDSAGTQALAASLRALDPAALIVPAAERERAIHLKNAHGWAHLAVLTDDDLRAAPPEAPPDPQADADRVALIFPTSGSTGAPKPVMQTGRALLAMSAGSAQMNAFDQRDIFLNWMPMEHVGAVVFLGVLPMCALADQVHVDHRLWRDRMPDWLDGLTRFRASVGWVPDHVLHIVAQALERPLPPRRWDLSALRFLVDAGESISPVFVRRFAQRLRPFGLQEGAIRPAFGMSETCSGITWAQGFHTVEGRYVDLGAPIPGAQLRIVDAHGQVLPEGRIGRLQLRGPSVTAGYFGGARDEKFLAGGWFDAGDAGFIQDGRLYLTDREGDGLALPGVALHGHEIETAIESLPGVLAGHAAVCTATLGDTPVLAAFFCIDPVHPAPAQVRAGVEAVLRSNVPGVHPVVQVLAPQELPRTSIGKIQRKVLRRRLERAAGAGVPEKTASAGVPEKTTSAGVPEKTTSAGVPEKTTSAGVPARAG